MPRDRITAYLELGGTPENAQANGCARRNPRRKITYFEPVSPRPLAQRPADTPDYRVEEEACVRLHRISLPTEGLQPAVNGSIPTDEETAACSMSWDDKD